MSYSTDATETEARAETRVPTGASPRLLGTITREMATQDWLVLGYLTVVVAAVARGARTPDYARAVLDAGAYLVWFAANLALVRGKLIRNELVAGLFYRVSTVCAVEGTYFLFRRILPIINPGSLDESLYQFDLRVFGVEPAMWMQRWISPATTEWFSFMYWGYFLVLTAHVLGLLLGPKRERALLNEFTLGVLTIFCVGHIIYFLVPGFGPGVAMPHRFEVPLTDGPIFRMMNDWVESGGARKDIFPSIHTAIPTFITLWTIRHSNKKPWKYTALFMVFFTVNVVLATMFLRWHYLIDVVAGMTLAVGAFLFASRVTSRELAIRSEHSLRPVWPEYSYFGRKGHFSKT